LDVSAVDGSQSIAAGSGDGYRIPILYEKAKPEGSWRIEVELPALNARDFGKGGVDVIDSNGVPVGRKGDILGASVDGGQGESFMAAARAGAPVIEACNVADIEPEDSEPWIVKNRNQEPSALGRAMAGVPGFEIHPALGDILVESTGLAFQKYMASFRGAVRADLRRCEHRLDSSSIEARRIGVC
jgi:hypothetical protein